MGKQEEQEGSSYTVLWMRYGNGMKADREHCVDDQETGRITIKVTKLEKI